MNSPKAPELPPELISRILKLAAPPEQIYADRLKILTSASLVARSWRDTAQKELFRLVAVDVGRQLRALVSALSTRHGGKQLASWIVELAVGGRPAERVSARALDQLTRRCLNVTKLCLSWIADMRLSDQRTCKSRLVTLIIEHTTFRVNYRGDEDVYPTIRFVSLHACSIVGLSSPVTDHPLGRFPNVRAISFTRAEQPSLGKRAPAYRGRSAISNYQSRYVPVSTERCSTLLSSFESSLKIISAESNLGLVDGLSTPEVAASIEALDVAPPLGFDVPTSPSDALSFFVSISPRILRLPIEPGLLQSLQLFLQNGSDKYSSLEIISLVPRGPPYNFSLYSSPECKAFEAFCNERGIRLVYEDAPSTATPFSENEFWRFVRRVEEEQFGKARREEEELVEKMGNLAT